MPPKASKTASKAAEQPGVVNHADNVSGKAPLAVEGKPVPKMQSTLFLWSHALAGESQREEVFKAQVLPALLTMLDRGSTEERWAACGALHALAHSEKHIAEVVNTKMIVATSSLLSSAHDRSKQAAAQLLAHLAQRLEYANRVADNALLPLLQCCAPGAINAWAGARMTALYAVTAIRTLIENIQGDAPGVKASRRSALIAAGAIPILAHMVTYTPRLPEPKQAPIVPTLGSKKGGGGGSGGGKGRKGAQDRPQAGRKDALATQAAACLRFLSLCPEFKTHLLETGSVRPLVRSLLTSNAEQAAYVCGILWEITADQDTAQQVCDAEGVKCLLHVVSSHLSGAKSKSKSSKGGAKGSGGKEGSSSSSKKAERGDATGPPNYPEIAVCNASGALHHLSFLDTAKQQIGALGGAAILVPCLKLGNVQCFENATGALWNAGLHPDNTQLLVAAGAPEYLARPVPTDWMVKTEPDTPTAPLVPRLTFGHTHTGPSVFITQAT